VCGGQRTRRLGIKCFKVGKESKDKRGNKSESVGRRNSGKEKIRSKIRKGGRDVFASVLDLNSYWTTVQCITLLALQLFGFGINF
jgi:hypothetical protein